MDLCNKLLWTSFLLIALSLGLHIFTSPATIHNAMETTGHKTRGNNRKVTTHQENNMPNLNNNSSNNGNMNTSNNSSTIPNRHNSTNSTVSDSTQHNSTVPGPTVTTTQQTNVAATKTSFATQSASDSTRAAVSTTLSAPVSAVHGSNESTSMSTPAYLTTGMALGNKTNNETATGAGLNHTETLLTILFGAVLGVIVLIILGLSVYKMTRSKRTQYSHRPLHNDDTGGPFVVTDDTLVISGGLYDGPQIYNSTVTALNEDQTFTYTPTQFRLEFLDEERATDHVHEATTFKTFTTTNQQS